MHQSELVLTPSHLLFILYVIYDVFEVEWVLCQVFSLATEWHRFLVVRFVRLWIFSDHFFDEIAVDLIG